MSVPWKLTTNYRKVRKLKRNMKPEQINTAIAEACGWNGHCDKCSQGIVEHFDGDGNYAGSSGCDYCQGQPVPIPNYCHDLNAMHDAEKELSYDEIQSYKRKLNRVCGPATHPIFAEASERAEAFLRTIGKWRDE